MSLGCCRSRWICCRALGSRLYIRLRRVVRSRFSVDCSQLHTYTYLVSAFLRHERIDSAQPEYNFIADKVFQKLCIEKTPPSFTKPLSLQLLTIIIVIVIE